VTPPISDRVARTSWRLPGASDSERAGRGIPAGAVTDSGTARIAVDLLGGDGAPAVVVDGALRACRADPDLKLLLVGPPEVADEVLVALPPGERDRVARYAGRRTPGVPGASSHGSSAVPGGPPVIGSDSATVRAAVDAVVDGTADALISAGASGAIVTAAVLGLGRWPSERRPALVATLPAVGGSVVLLDVGASVEARPATLVRHAMLGAAYAAVVLGVSAPRIGLLSIGTEPGKGDRARRAADTLLRGLALPARGRYIGLVEGYDVALGAAADVVITDGFTGNVLLKGIEGAYAMAGGPPPGCAVPRAAALLGVAGVAVVCHGAATGDDIASGIALAASIHRGAVLAGIAQQLTDLDEGTP